MQTVIDRILVTSHRLEVPLDWTNPAGPSISLSVREVVGIDNVDKNLPPLCYFRGGPGFEAPAPINRNGWLAESLKRYRVFLLDQRGTGRSTPIDVATANGRSGAELANHLTHFRADSIIKDAEHVRKTLLGGERWAIQGQSFGGFCVLTYLSFFPEALDGAILTGGFAPVLREAIDVYRALGNRVAERNERYYKQFPDDVDAVKRIVDHLESQPNMCAPDWQLSARQFLTLGNMFGQRHGAAAVHEIVDRANADLDTLGTLSRWALTGAADPLSLSTNPIYAALHEPIYCSPTPSRWAAQRAIDEDERFSATTQQPSFTGEMIFPWMFDELPALRPFKGAAEILAEKTDWPAVYDPNRLAGNEVPVAGTIYYDDLYVDRGFAIETAELVGNCKFWITNEYEHDGYSDDPQRIMTRLFDMLDETKAAVAARR